MEPANTAASTKSLTTQAFEQLRADILLGQLRPAERLRIQGLSDRYSVGATAIREALSRLVTDGLVEVEDQRGFCVAPVSRSELIDLTETRISIENLALAAAIEKGSVDWESQVLSAYHRLSKAPLPTTAEHHAHWSVVHRQFHETLIAGCHSPWLLRVCHLLYDKTERYRNLAGQRTHPGDRDVAVEHRALMDAAMARDVATATRLLAAHFRQTSHTILATDFAGAGQALSAPVARSRPRPEGR